MRDNLNGTTGRIDLALSLARQISMAINRKRA
jgi:hypothetical protein